MARITYTVEIAGVTDEVASSFMQYLRGNAMVVNVEQEHVGLDCPEFPPLKVFPKPLKLKDEPEGYVICHWDTERGDDRPHPNPLMWNDRCQDNYDYDFNQLLGQLNPTKLRSDALTDYVNLCFNWVRICMRELGCDDHGRFATLEDAEAALPKLNWALRNPGKKFAH